MFIKKIDVDNFRNLESVSINIEHLVTVFEGQNGQGKTNLVECLYFLSKGKSFRTSQYLHLIKNNQEKAFVHIHFEHENLSYEADVSISHLGKSFLLNKKKTIPLKIFSKLPIIFFSPESLQSIKEGPEGRRNLLDESSLFEDPDNLKIHNDFKKVLKARNKILKDYQQGYISEMDTHNLLDSHDSIFNRLTWDIVTMRKRLINKLLPHMNKVLKDITNDPHVETSVEYVVNENNNEITDQNLTKIHNIARQLDMKLGYTQSGPQKHDVIFLYNGKDSRFFSSQGQQRALILAFKFAQIMYHSEVYGYYPILILDDVLSELDWEKRNFLLNFIKRSEIQTFLTTTEFTDSEQWVGMDVSVFKVEKGLVKRI